MFEHEFDIPTIVREPSVEYEKDELLSKIGAGRKTYIESRLAAIGSDLMNNRYQRNDQVDAVIMHLKEELEKLED